MGARLTPPPYRRPSPPLPRSPSPPRSPLPPVEVSAIDQDSTHPRTDARTAVGQAAADLVQELVLVQTQAEEVDAQDLVVSQRDLIAAEVVGGHLKALAMLDTVDLDDEGVAVPADVEVHPAARPSTMACRVGSGRPLPAQLAKSSSPSDSTPSWEVADHVLDERRAGLRPRSRCDHDFSCCGGKALLDGHDQDERGLPIRNSPTGTRNAATAGFVGGVQRPPPRQADAGSPCEACARHLLHRAPMDHRNMDRIVGEVPQTSCLQGGHPIDGGESSPVSHTTRQRCSSAVSSPECRATVCSPWSRHRPASTSLRRRCSSRPAARSRPRHHRSVESRQPRRPVVADARPQSPRRPARGVPLAPRVRIDPTVDSWPAVRGSRRQRVGTRPEPTDGDIGSRYDRLLVVADTSNGRKGRSGQVRGAGGRSRRRGRRRG